MARPTALTEDLADRLVLAAEKGLTAADACRVAGVPLRTFRRWLAEGKKLLEGDEESTESLAVFARQVHGARGIAATNAINAAAKTDWRAAAFMLEKLDPETFGPGRVIGRDLDRLERRVDALACKMGVDLAAVGA